MAIFEVDFIFCCPCFVPDIFKSRFHEIRRNFEFSSFVHRRHLKKPFDIDNFREQKSMFVCCFDHLAEAIYLDFVDCLHYYKSIFYRVLLDNYHYPKRKSYICYRRRIRKLLKYFPRFVV